MPSVKLRASVILGAFEEAQSELVGKAVVLTDGKAGTVENVWLDEFHGLRISIGGHDGKWPISTIKFAEKNLSAQADRTRSALVKSTGSAADCGFRGGGLAAGYYPDRTNCSVPNRARTHLRGLAGLVCDHAVGRQLVAGATSTWNHKAVLQPILRDGHGACHRARIRATRWWPPQDEV